MTLTYRLSQDPEEHSADVADFQAFESWLWGLGGGAQIVSRENRTWWAESWRNLLASPPDEPVCLALPRRLPPGVVTIIKTDAPPRA